MAIYDDNGYIFKALRQIGNLIHLEPVSFEITDILSFSRKG